MKMTADQLLKIAGIASTDTLRARLDESVRESSYEYNKKTGQMGRNDSDKDQRHGLYVNGKLVKTLNSRDEAENVKKRDSRFKTATVNKIVESHLNELGDDTLRSYVQKASNQMAPPKDLPDGGSNPEANRQRSLAGIKAIGRTTNVGKAMDRLLGKNQAYNDRDDEKHAVEVGSKYTMNDLNAVSGVFGSNDWNDPATIRFFAPFYSTQPGFNPWKLSYDAFERFMQIEYELKDPLYQMISSMENGDIKQAMRQATAILRSPIQIKFLSDYMNTWAYEESAGIDIVELITDIAHGNLQG